MAPGQNGTAVAEISPGVLHLPDIAYERATVMVTILGEPLALKGWVAGLGCPGTVKAEFARKHRQMQVSPDAGGAAYHEFLTAAMSIVFEDGISYVQADLLAGDVDRAEAILRHFRWYKEQDAADPEVTSEESQTTPISSPTSSDATAASAPTDAAG